MFERGVGTWGGEEECVFFFFNEKNCLFFFVQFVPWQSVKQLLPMESVT